MAPLTFSIDLMMRSAWFLPVVASMKVGQPYFLCISPMNPETVRSRWYMPKLASAMRKVPTCGDSALMREPI